MLYFKVIKVIFSICKKAFGLFRFCQVNPDWYNQEFLVVSVLLDHVLASIWPQWSLDPHMQRMRGYRNLVLNQMPPVQWCVVKYDGLPYPGIIQNVDVNDIEVKVMHRIGTKIFFWPLLEDVLWYSHGDVHWTTKCSWESAFSTVTSRVGICRTKFKFVT